MDQTTMNVTIESLAPMRVASYRSFSPYPEMDGAKFMAQWVAERNLSEPTRDFGFDIDVTPEQRKAGLRGYEFWRTVPAMVQPSGGVTIKEFEGGLYAVVTLEKASLDPFAIIPPGWKALHEWVITHPSYRGGNQQWLEEKISHPDGDDLKLYYPLAPAECWSK
jgi:DNA gyrase inhibitor GyrI